MDFKLTHFRIEGLHGTRTIDVPIKDNQLILVGENGTGKSTVANFIYFVVSRQWNRLLQYEFSRIIVEINGEEITLNYDELSYMGNIDKEIARTFKNIRLPSSVINELSKITNGLDILELLEDYDWIRRTSDNLGMPTRYVIEYLRVASRDDSPLFSKKIRDINQRLRLDIQAQILYLPTYRRIEKELKAIRPELLGDITKNLSERFPKNSKQEHYVELVEFGMQDVIDTIKLKLLTLKDTRNTDYKNMTGKYLGEVIEGEFGNVTVERLREINQDILNGIFNRVGEDNLADTQKEALRQILAKAGNIDLSDKDKVVAHFLIQLDEFRRSQELNERDVVDFVSICNSYLIGKELQYDSSTFELHIFQDGREIEWSMLSSGEKQIVSLFSHIYLSNNNKFFVIIDEPELSLSITWQQRFLPSILKTKKCIGLIAVTHSPFVFDNEFDTYTFDLQNFVSIRE